MRKRYKVFFTIVLKINNSTNKPSIDTATKIQNKLELHFLIILSITHKFPILNVLDLKKIKYVIYKTQDKDG